MPPCWECGAQATVTRRELHPTATGEQYDTAYALSAGARGGNTRWEDGGWCINGKRWSSLQSRCRVCRTCAPSVDDVAAAIAAPRRPQPPPQ